MCHFTLFILSISPSIVLWTDICLSFRRCSVDDASGVTRWRHCSMRLKRFVSWWLFWPFGQGWGIIFYSVGVGCTVHSIDITCIFDKKLNKIHAECNNAGQLKRTCLLQIRIIFPLFLHSSAPIKIRVSPQAPASLSSICYEKPRLWS